MASAVSSVVPVRQCVPYVDSGIDDVDHSEVAGDSRATKQTTRHTTRHPVTLANLIIRQMARFAKYLAKRKVKQNVHDES